MAPSYSGYSSGYAMSPSYGYDGDFFRAYAGAHGNPETAQAFWDERIAGPETHAAFLDANGGPKTLLSIARRTT